MIAILLLSPNQDGADLATLLTGASHVGRQASWRRPQAYTGLPAERPAPATADAHGGAPGARDPAQRARSSLLAIQPRVSRCPPSALRGLPRKLPDHSFHGPGRPSPSHLVPRLAGASRHSARPAARRGRAHLACPPSGGADMASSG